MFTASEMGDGEHGGEWMGMRGREMGRGAGDEVIGLCGGWEHARMRRWGTKGWWLMGEGKGDGEMKGLEGVMERLDISR